MLQTAANNNLQDNNSSKHLQEPLLAQALRM
jgi:hypothetical protein